MGSLEFETKKEELRKQLELELFEKAGNVLRDLVTEILADPRTITASILGIDVEELLKKVINEKLDEYTKEE